MRMPVRLRDKGLATRDVATVLCCLFVCVLGFCGTVKPAEGSVHSYTVASQGGWADCKPSSMWPYALGAPPGEPHDLIVPSFDETLGKLTSVTVSVSYHAEVQPYLFGCWDLLPVYIDYIDVTSTVGMMPLLVGLPIGSSVSSSFVGSCVTDGTVVYPAYDDNGDLLPLFITWPRPVGTAGGTLTTNLEQFTCQPGDLHLYRPSCSVTGSATCYAAGDCRLFWVLGWNHWNATVTYYYVDAPHIVIPQDGATRQSQYCAVEGTGQAGKTVEILRDGETLADATVDSEGGWEKVIKVGVGTHEIRAQYAGDASTCTTCPVHTTYNGPIHDTPGYEGVWQKMRKADLMFTSGGFLDVLFGPNFSHVFLYLGGTSDGTPYIGEAMPDDGVACKTVETSSAGVHGDYVTLCRPKTALTHAQRQGVVDYVHSHAGCPYWSRIGFPSVFGDFQCLMNAARFFGKPERIEEYNAALAQCQIQKLRQDRFLCSTLVWQAYLNATGGNPLVDFSTPNYATLTNGFLAPFLMGTSFSGTLQAFDDAMEGYYVVPDTIELNIEKLEEVFVPSAITGLQHSNSLPVTCVAPRIGDLERQQVRNLLRRESGPISAQIDVSCTPTQTGSTYEYAYQLLNSGSSPVLVYDLAVQGDVSDLSGPEGWAGTIIPYADYTIVDWMSSDPAYDIPADSLPRAFSLKSALKPGNVAYTATNDNLDDFSGQTLGPVLRPIVALNGRAVYDPIIGVAKDNYRFKVFGRVTVIDPTTFTLDDGSGTPIKVVAPNHVPLTDGDYASAFGDLDNTVAPAVIQSSQEGVVRLY
jgi:hypothetical protein